MFPQMVTCELGPCDGAWFGSASFTLDQLGWCEDVINLFGNRPHDQYIKIAGVLIQ